MQALVITAYSNKQQLMDSIKLYSEYFKIYIHIDKKSELNDIEYLKQLNNIKNVTAISRYPINWGSYLHMIAILDLLKMTVQDPDIERVHIISGQDFPIKPYEQFEHFFHQNPNNYIELTDIRNMPAMKLRYEKYHFQHIFNRKSRNVFVKYTDKVIRQLQYHLPFRRKIKFDYKGLVWSSLSMEGVKRVIEYMTPERIKSLKYCETAEEFMVQNALMNSSLQNTIVTDNLRYDDWTGCWTGPKILSIDDYEKIKSSSSFFARKILNYSNEKEYNLLYEQLVKDFLA